MDTKGTRIVEIWIVARDDAPGRRVGGRSLLGRILETLRLCGQESAVLIAAPGTPAAGGYLPDDLPLPCPAIDGQAPAPDSHGTVLVVEADRVYDPRLLQTMLARPAGTRLCEGERAVGLATVAGAAVDRHAPALAAVDDAVEGIPAGGRLDLDAIPRYHPGLRRSLPPWWLRVRDAESVREARRRLADGASKGTMEWLVIVLNRPLERWLSLHLAETSITPNQITVAGNLVAYAAAALIAVGYPGAGLGLALTAQVLDGLDGRQARIQMRFSPAGKLEHVFDKAFEIAWMLALTWHLSMGGDRPGVVAAGLGWIAATIVANLAGSRYRNHRGVLPEQETRLDARIRLLGFRRNTSIAILFLGWTVELLAPAFWLVVAGSGLTALLLQARTWILLRRGPRGSLVR